METLLKKNNCKTRWYPHSVEDFKCSILIPNDSADNKRYNSNFAYSMQYLQYIEKQLGDLELSSVIITMGIVEMLFTYILKTTNNWNTTDWIEIQTFKSNPTTLDENQFKTETTLLKKVESFDMRMDLDSMIKRIEKKHLISINHSDFPALKQLRELRNRVHLQSGESAYDHDYNAFGNDEYKLMKRILYSILTTPEICKNDRAFEFINVEE